VAQGVVHDTASGRRAGCMSTGHAQCDDEFPTSGSRAAHIHMEPGTGSPEEMVQRVGRGLLVTRFHYVNGMLEPRRAVMTGLLRDGAFLIEDGRQGRAVRTLRFTDSILEALGRIKDSGCISRDLEAHNSWFGPDQCFVAPWLLIPGLKFTSGR
jgi:PmbA protein